MPTMQDAKLGRERTFWDEHVPDFQSCLHVFERGPSASVAAVLDALEPLAGRRVLDFACGPGTLSAWMAARGAEVTGVDISERSVQRARELSAHLGLDATFTTSLEDLPAGSFDAIAGEYALHHVDLEVVAFRLSELLVPGGPAAFVETMALNPVLSLARARLAGRGPVARWGSDDEQPLDRDDLATLRAAFGNLSLQTREMQFLRLIDRNLLRGRVRVMSRLLGAADDWLLRRGLGQISYCQVVTVRGSS